jgi:pimeloyl-ACP methyl ester carboxylesterase
MRDAITIKLEGLVLHGTSHLNPGGLDLGILFLNSGSLPRSSRGDLYAHLADSLAEQGFKCFRVDLPGLGDSQGEVPEEYVEFYKFVQEGTYAGCVAKLARELRRTYGLSGIVLAGICGGAQTSVFAAARDHGTGIAGLALLDMPFFLYRSSNPAAQKKAGLSFLGRCRCGVVGAKAKMRDWVLTQKWEPLATKTYYRLRKMTSRTKGGSLPPNTNLILLKTLSALLDQGIPVLMVTAHPPIPERQSFDYIGYVADRPGGRLEHAKIHGTTHSFVENGGAEAVREALARWLAGLSPKP